MGSKRVRISSMTELRQKTDEGSTLEVFFDLKDEQGQQLLNYKTAQNMAMFPENTDVDTNAML